VLQGRPIERIGYRYGRGFGGVYICDVHCAKPHHQGEDLFSACPRCLGEMLADHPNAWSRADIEAWEHFEEQNRD
jgi:hypothetical protein